MTRASVVGDEEIAYGTSGCNTNVGQSPAGMSLLNDVPVSPVSCAQSDRIISVPGVTCQNHSGTRPSGTQNMRKRFCVTVAAMA